MITLFFFYGLQLSTEKYPNQKSGVFLISFSLKQSNKNLKWLSGPYKNYQFRWALMHQEDWVKVQGHGYVEFIN